MKPAILISGEQKCREGILHLHRDGQYDLVLYPSDQVGAELRARGIAYERFEDYLTPVAVQRAVAHLERIKSTIAIWRQAPETQVAFSIGGHTFWPLIQEQFTATALRAMGQTIMFYEAFRLLLAGHPLAALVVPHDALWHTKALTLAARYYGVPSLHLSHGNVGTYPLPERPKQEIHAPVQTDWLAACGTRERELATWYGYPPDRIVVTGRPSWDYVHEPWPDRQSARAQMGVDPQRRVLLYCSTWMSSYDFEDNPGIVENTFRAFVRAIAPDDERDYTILVKPHPAELQHEAEALYRGIAAEYGLDVIVVAATQHPKLAIAASDVVICIESNIGVEALLADRQVISLVLSFPRCRTIFDDLPAVRQVTKETDILPAVREALNGRAQSPEFQVARRQALAYLAGPSDGRAGERVLALIKQVALRADSPDIHLNTLLAQAPDHADGWLLKGTLAMRRRDYMGAITAFETALQHGGDPRRARLGLGMAAFWQGQAEQSWEIFMQVLSDDPDDAEAIHWLLRVGTALERWEALAGQLADFLRLNPGDLAVRFALAGVYVRLANWQAARQEYGTLRLLQPTFEGLDELAQALDMGEQASAHDAGDAQYTTVVSDTPP